MAFFDPFNKEQEFDFLKTFLIFFSWNTSNSVLKSALNGSLTQKLQHCSEGCHANYRSPIFNVGFFCGMFCTNFGDHRLRFGAVVFLQVAPSASE